MKKNAFSFVLLFLISLIFAVCTSCGGGGGGATLYNQDDGPHNGGGGGSWGAGTTSGNSGNAGSDLGSSADEPLFNLFPRINPPIESIDILFYKNGVACEPLTGLNSSATQGMLPQFKIGDEIYGSAVIHLQDGSSRNATLPNTEVTLNTHLSFITEFKYTLINTLTNDELAANEIFTTAAGIDTTPYAADLVNTVASQVVVSWKDRDTGVMYPHGNRIYPNAGDTTLETVWGSSSGSSGGTPPAAPVIDSTVPANCALVFGSKIAITAESGATVYYTLNGSTPNSSSRTLDANGKAELNALGGPFTLTAIAEKNGQWSTTTTATYTMLPIKEPDAVGDIVFKDGTAVAYNSNIHLTEEMQTKFADEAVAYVFYKGTGCSNDGTTERMLEVGIRLTTEQQAWCDTSANGRDELISSIDPNCKNGSQNLEKIGTWLTAIGETDDTSSNYPAFSYAKNYGTRNGLSGADASGWYLPSKTELSEVSSKKTEINAVCDLCGLTGFEPDNSNYYWTSTQADSSSQINYAYILQTGSGFVVSDKTSLAYALAVRQASSAADTLMTVTAPSISVDSGKKLLSGADIQITCTDTTASIYYKNDAATTYYRPYSDATKPTITGTAGDTVTLKAVAKKSGISSDPVTATYTITNTKTSPDAIGDIVFSDGTVVYNDNLYLTDAQKNNAIAYIVYVGTECDDLGASPRTIGVGLNISTVKWCTSSASAYSININQSGMNFKNGTDNFTRMQIAISAAGLNNDSNDSSKYPAFYYAKNYGTTYSLPSAYASDWYLPSETEMKKVRVQINAIKGIWTTSDWRFLETLDSFWTSTPSNSDNTKMSLVYTNGSAGAGVKELNNKVCAVRAF